MDSDEQCDIGKIKTRYVITDEDGSPTEITLDKSVSDFLHEVTHDVHKWLQEKFNRVCETNPELTRVAKGDMVRQQAFAEMGRSAPSDF